MKPAAFMNQVNGNQAARREQLCALIDQLSAYIETYHGGSLSFVDFDGKVLKVHLGGACTGCRNSLVTLHGYVEGLVRQFFPEVQRVENIE